MNVKFNFDGKYGIYFYGDDHSWDAGTAFDSLDTALAYCERQIDDFQQAYFANVYSLETGEIIAKCAWETPEDEDDFCDDVDESNYDPYIGCDFYDCDNGFEY